MKKSIIAAALFFWVISVPSFADTVKNTNVAGGFYPSNSQELTRLVDGFVAQASDEVDAAHVDVAIAPHAGYVYSGSVAGFVFKGLAKTPYTTVIVLAPSHFFPFKGASIWPHGSFATPLGNLPVDEGFASALMAKTPVVADIPQVFEKEHALEVQLPFIQRTFPKAKIVPILLGDADIKVCEQMALALNELIGQRSDVLVLISSDMSHYLPYDANNAKDVRTLGAITRGDIEGFWNGNVSRDMEMCGFVPTTVGMMLAKLRGLSEAKVLKHANSGDTTGDKSRVVGYAAIVFEKPQGLSQVQKNKLLELARGALESFVREGSRGGKPQLKDARLEQIQGAFVTLTKKGQLRGCIGNIIGQTPLAQTVVNMAVAAASEDHRFPPVKEEELKDIHVEVSVLSVPKKIDRIDQIELGRDGVILSSTDGHQGVFLPQVATETNWSKEEFLSELCSQKAGLDALCYQDPSVSKYTFTAEVFDEK